AVAATDVDLDGDVDPIAIVGGLTDVTLLVFQNQGGGTFTLLPTVFTGFPAASPIALAVVDIGTSPLSLAVLRTDLIGGASTVEIFKPLVAPNYTFHQTITMAGTATGLDLAVANEPVGHSTSIFVTGAVSHDVRATLDYKVTTVAPLITVIPGATTPV